MYWKKIIQISSEIDKKNSKTAKINISKNYISIKYRNIEHHAVCCLRSEKF